MNECNCKTQNCKHIVYTQPPRGIPKQRRTRYVRSDIPIQYETEQKVSYTNKHFTQCDASIKNASTKSNYFGGIQHPMESIQHSSYRKWTNPNKLEIKKPKDCAGLIGHGSINLITSQKIEFQRKIISPPSMKLIS